MTKNGVLIVRYKGYDPVTDRLIHTFAGMRSEGSGFHIPTRTRDVVFYGPLKKIEEATCCVLSAVKTNKLLWDVACCENSNA